MVDLSGIGIAWQEIVNWFLAQPIWAQVLVIIGVFAVLVLAVILVYYILKGVAYLVYYLLKGVYYLLKGIGLLFYKLFEGLYYAISGKPKPQKAPANPEQPSPQQAPPQVKQEEEPIIPIQKYEQIVHPEVAYCSECGNRFTDSMIQTLTENGFAYCIHCGNKKTQANQMSIESQ
ncbi:MAG: hypothetical protein JSV62_04730 [Promethearchaeota archaeon]|nr:MAG: hypothetical protein JSV62_04730 [Candidatus Lokiarchaeota archaeon]